MTGTGSADRVGDPLASRRRHRFVGRTSEVELFRVALESPEPLFLVLHIHGPPGIGKTSLLDVCAELATDAGAKVIRLEGHDLVPSPTAVLEALGVLEVPAGQSHLAALPDAGRLVIMFDTYERLGPLDEWVRTWLVPRLPATALTVLAGRTAPDPAWRADPAWRELLRVVSLRNLSPEDSRQYLHTSGVDPTRVDQLVELAHGHPLGLSLLADVVVRGGDATADPLTPDLVGTLLRRFVEIVPSGQHRRALEMCSLARVTTETLLREVLGLEDVHELFAWLRELTFMESGREGVYPHDLARDALEADLRWRDPEGYRQLVRGLRGYINRRLQTSRGQEQQRAIADAKYMFRRLPGVPSPVDWAAWGQQHPRTYRLSTDALNGDLAILDAATPQLPRTGALLALEGDRWMLTLAGILGDQPPTDPDGFLGFTRSLRFSDIHEAICDAEPLDDPVSFRFPASVRHHYERLPRFPEGLLVTGDAVCSFNPIYGQGMTVAALEALTLRRHLGRGIATKPHRWFRDVARVVNVPWDMSAGGDLAFPGVPGRETVKVRLLSAYLAKLRAAAAQDARLATAFIRVSGLVAPPQSLFHPSVVLPVLRRHASSGPHSSRPLRDTERLTARLIIPAVLDHATAARPLRQSRRAGV